MSTLCYLRHDSPVGPLLVAASENGLHAVYMSRQRHVPDNAEQNWQSASHEHPAQLAILERAMQQLDEYFAGKRCDFDLPLDLVGSQFQRSVWKGLCGIGFGETISYGELARRIGNPNAVRAVGLANGRNPVSIIVPCHRVIARMAR
jgi:methylated-DNA-[protein]-cysteine S-methyltransferase